MCQFKLLIVLLSAIAVSSNRLGGFNKKDPKDPHCVRLADVSMALQNAAKNGNRVIKNFERCATELVAGKNTILQVKVCNKEANV